MLKKRKFPQIGYPLIDYLYLRPLLTSDEMCKSKTKIW
jgi:hypothetical protein